MLQRLGTKYGGWILPSEAGLGPDSVAYCAGAGEDISFDLLLQAKYGCKVVIIDPTPRALRHFEECKAFFATGNPSFSGDIQPDYLRLLSTISPDFSKIDFVPIGLYDRCSAGMPFFAQENPRYVSRTLCEGMFTDRCEETVPTKDLQSLMADLGHTSIDLLKMDIEGAEVAVLEDLLAKRIFPGIICVECDLLLKKRDRENRTVSLLQRFLASKEGDDEYLILANLNWNVTLRRTIRRGQK